MSDPLPEWVEGSMEERFSAIYRNRFWEETESLSGPGSSRAQARRLIEDLPRIWAELKVRSVLDIPCGDFNWMQATDLSSVEYIGGDIVEDLIQANRRQHERPGVRFLLLDITAEVPPRCDFVLCRDLLVHFSFQHICDALNRLVQSGALYLMTTTFPGCEENRDVETGDWRTLNLELAPFHFPKPIRLLVEECPEEGYQDKSLGLWRISDVEALLPLGRSASP